MDAVDFTEFIEIKHRRFGIKVLPADNWEGRPGLFGKLDQIPPGSRWGRPEGPGGFDILFRYRRLRFPPHKRFHHKINGRIFVPPFEQFVRVFYGVLVNFGVGPSVGSGEGTVDGLDVPSPAPARPSGSLLWPPPSPLAPRTASQIGLVFPISN